MPIFKENGSGGIVQELAPFTTVTLLKREGAGY